MKSSIVFCYNINKLTHLLTCRLRPGYCHLGSYFKRPKSSPVGLQLVLLRTVYSQAEDCVYTALQLGGDVE